MTETTQNGASKSEDRGLPKERVEGIKENKDVEIEL
jgi:hypothetical protein